MCFIATFISLHKVHFARVSRHEKVVALFVTSWPMLFVATFMNSINWPASSVWVFIAQLGEHCSANAEATGSNPVEAPKIFFFGLFSQLLKLRFTAMVTYSFHLFHCKKYILLEFPGMRRFWHYLLPHGRCYSWQRLFHCIKYILLEFPGMRRFWHYLLPHGRCYSLQHLFHCITVHFARVSRHEKVLALFVTSWPMLFVATFISLHNCTFCSSFPA